MQQGSPAGSAEKPPSSGTPACTVATWGAFHSTVDQLEAVRQPANLAGNPLSTTFLRHADEMTVAAVAAVTRALAHSELTSPDMRNWGVLGCLPRPGRALVAHSLARFQSEGAWGISPHIVPHRCLHSLSGTLSLALKCEGPNFGVGELEAMFPLACAWLSQGRVPGLWVVLTETEPDLPPDLARPTAPPRNGVHALALALLPESAEGPMRLRIRPGNATSDGWDLAHVENWLAGREGLDWPLRGGLTVERRGALTAPPEAPGRGVNCLQEVR